MRAFYGSYPCRVAQPTVATKLTPSPVTVTVSADVGQEARFALAEFKFSAAGVAQQCTTVGAQGDSGTARRQFRLLAGKREPVQAEFRCRGFIHDSAREPGSGAVYAGSNPAGGHSRRTQQAA